MSKNYAMSATKRDGAGKGIARAVRRENRVPAVIYGDKKEPVIISLSARDVKVEYHKGQMFTKLCDLDVDGNKHLVLVRDVQTHPVTDNVMHIDFLRVTPKTKIAVDVPVQFINEDKSPGMDQKGILNVVRYTVELLCAATNIPDIIEVNLEGKEHGDSINVSDANLPEGTKPVISDRDFTIATLLAPRKVDETASETGEAEEAAEGGEAPAEEAASE